MTACFKTINILKCQHDVKRFDYEHAELFQKFRHTAHEITSDTVFQEGNAELQATMEAVISPLLEPDSRVIGSEHLFTLLEKVKAGKRCLILPEHYSNFDYPLITLLFKRLGEKGEELSKRLVAMAGIKLSEENDMISMMNTAYESSKRKPKKLVRLTLLRCV